MVYLMKTNCPSSKRAKSSENDLRAGCSEWIKSLETALQSIALEGGLL